MAKIKKQRIKEVTSIEDLEEQLQAIDKEINEHPLRFYHYSSKTDEDSDFEVDLKSPVHRIRQAMELNKAKSNDIEFAILTKKNIYVNDLSIKKRAISRKMTDVAKENGGLRGDLFILKKYESFMLEHYGALRTVKEVHAMLTKKGIVVPLQTLYEWKQLNEEKVTAAKARYMIENRTDSTRIGTDIGRLNIMNDLLNHYIEKNEEEHSDRNSKFIIQILEQARKETKGDIITINGKIDIAATVNANKSIDEIFSKIPINSLVVGLVASQQQIDPLHIMTALATSYYNKFNSFASNPSDDVVELPSALIKSFDWGNISRNVEEANPKPKSIDKALYLNGRVADKEKVRNNLLNMLQDVKYEEEGGRINEK